MSQIDDDYDRRAHERLLLEKQRIEDDRKSRSVGDSKFAKLVSQGASELKKGTDQRREQGGDEKGKEVIAKAKKFSQKVQATDSVQSLKELPERRRDGPPVEERAHAQSDEAHLAQGHAADQAEFEQAQEGRHTDISEGEERLEERKDSSEHHNAGQAGQRKAVARADDGGGRQGGGGGGKKGDSDSGASQAFRLNPALMAPPAVAQPRASPMNEKLRALANEIAQKIVQSVRVGTNRAGDAEFQIELKSTVLAGLQIKVSGRNGKISAEFSGRDPEVMALLKKNADGLKEALSARGLLLVDLKIEERK